MCSVVEPCDEIVAETFNYSAKAYGAVFSDGINNNEENGCNDGKETRE